MTTQDFIQAIRGMHGLTALMTEHLEAIADKLSEEQRSKAVRDLTKIDGGIVEVLESQATLYQEGEVRIHQELKKMTKTEEANTHSQEAGDAESALNNL